MADHEPLDLMLPPFDLDTAINIRKLRSISIVLLCREQVSINKANVQNLGTLQVFGGEGAIWVICAKLGRSALSLFQNTYQS